MKKESEAYALMVLQAAQEKKNEDYKRSQSAKEVNSKWRPPKENSVDYEMFITQMTEKLKSELKKQIKMKSAIDKRNELRSAFSEGREFLRELTAQTSFKTVNNFTQLETSYAGEAN